MNRIILIGRLTDDPAVKESQSGIKVARYTLAVDRKKKDEGADFPSCVVFGRGAEFAEKYLNKGIKIAVMGHLKTGSYTNKNGQKVGTTDVIVEEQEFVERKRNENEDGFLNIRENVDDDPPFT